MQGATSEVRCIRPRYDDAHRYASTVIIRNPLEILWTREIRNYVFCLCKHRSKSNVWTRFNIVCRLYSNQGCESIYSPINVQLFLPRLISRLQSFTNAGLRMRFSPWFFWPHYGRASPLHISFRGVSALIPASSYTKTSTSSCSSYTGQNPETRNEFLLRVPSPRAR